MKMKLVETFSGIGMQRRGIENSGLFEVESVATCETDANAIISYAAIHNDMTMDMIDEYEDYPSREEMAQELTDMHINYDFVKNKEYNWEKIARSKDAKKQLQKTWLACKLTKNLGDITRVSEFPKCGMLTFSFPCFVEGTLVMTKDGYKEIQDIEVGEYVLTHTNTWQKVLETMVNKADKLIKINCMPSENIFCTPNHPFYVRELHRVHNPQTGSSERQFDPPKWIEAKDLTKMHYVGTAINQIEKLPDYNGSNVYIREKPHYKLVNTLGEDFKKPEFWYIIGRYIGDGWYCKSGGGIYLCANDEELHQLDYYLDALGYKYKKHEGGHTCTHLYIANSELRTYCQRFGTGAGNKHLTEDILNLPVNLLKEFLNGYIDSDGCFTQGRFKITSISRQLIYETAQCIMKVYHRPVSIYFIKRKAQTEIEGRIVNQKDQYQLTFKKDIGSQDHAFYEDGYIWSPINITNAEDTDEFVYNLEVENDNSYMIQNVICHNCTDRDF